MRNDVPIGIIGGSGLYHLDHLTVVEEVAVETPWGWPSDKIVIASVEDGMKIAFLSRHGRAHTLNPSQIPYRANIAALKQLGVKIIVAFSAVGSLREEIEPTHFVLPSQIIDRTMGIRANTFFDDGIVVHAGFADPFSRCLTNWIHRISKETCPDIHIHQNKTLVCMEGPAFSTRAESHLYRSWGCDIINMSAIPEAKLAREAELGYAMVCMSTDYDCWHETEESVTVEAVMKTMHTNSQHAKKLLAHLIPALAEKVQDLQRHFPSVYQLQGSMKMSCTTASNKRSPEAIEKLDYILPGCF